MSCLLPEVQMHAECKTNHQATCRMDEGKTLAANDQPENLMNLGCAQRQHMTKEKKLHVQIWVLLVQVYDDRQYDPLTSSNFPLGSDYSLNLACGRLETWHILHHSRDLRHAKRAFFFFFSFLEKKQSYQPEHGQCFAFQRQLVWGQQGLLSFIQPTGIHWWQVVVPEMRLCLGDIALGQTLVFNILALQFPMIHSSWDLSSGG